MNYEDFDKLKVMYSQLIELVCTAKEANTMDEKMDSFFKMFQIVRACLQFSPYTHFYTQVLIDLIVKTYNTKVFRSDLLFKSQIGVFIENPQYYAKEIYENLEENPYTIELILHEFTDNIDKISNKKHKEYIKYFETIRDLLINDFMEKRSDLKERLELISKYSNNSLVRNLSVPEKLFLYEAKRVFDIHYLNTNPAHALFLDTKFKTKYIVDKDLTIKEKQLDIEKIIEIMKKKNIVAKEVYELSNPEEQIRFELFKVIQNNFTINKCDNCGRLFIPITSSNNPNQKGRNDQKYCNSLFENTGKTCKEIGALNKQKEKVQNSPLLIEYNREYKRMHGLHYNHQKKFTEKKFKEWSKKARKLRDKFSDNQLEDFKIELKNLSDLYWK